MAVLVAFPFIGFLVILQSAVLSRMPLLQGTVDLPLLAVVAWAVQDRVTTKGQWAIIAGFMVSLTSGLPFGTFLIAYFTITAAALFLRRRVWRVSILSMLAASFLGTLLLQGISLVALLITGVLLPLGVVFNRIMLPGLFLNLLLALPVYLVVRDLANWLYPVEFET